MRLTAELSYPAPPERVFAMLLDPAFQDRKCVATGALEHEVTVEQVDGGGAVVTTRRRMPVEHVPEFVRPLVGRALWVTEVQDWYPAGADGRREGTVLVQIEGAPVRFTGTLVLDPDGEGTRENVDGQVRASVPLLGHRIERAVEPALESAISVEQRTGTAWLAGA